MSNYQTIKLLSCNNSTEAHIIQGILESEGIPSLVHNEHMSDLFPGLDSLFSNIDIFINEKDLNKANKVIKKIGFSEDTNCID